MNTAQATIETPFGNYRWIENWITIPDSPLGRTNGRTHGVAVLKSGEIVVFHQADPAVLFYSPAGELLRSWGCFPGAHGLTLVEENGAEYLWLTDEVTKDVVKMSLDGVVVSRLAQPLHSAYEKGSFIPTWVAVAEDRFGGSGDIWVADGYGCSLVHRFDRKGNLIGSLDGTEGGGRFNCPHGLALDTRRAEPEFYIADRGNKRFQVYGIDGVHRRTFGEDFLNSQDVCPNGRMPYRAGARCRHHNFGCRRPPCLLTRLSIRSRSPGGLAKRASLAQGRSFQQPSFRHR